MGVKVANKHLRADFGPRMNMLGLVDKAVENEER